MESEPKDSFPKVGEISWQDVTLQMIQDKIDHDDLDAARTLAAVRLEGGV